MNPNETISVTVLGQKIEVESITNPTLKAVLSSAGKPQKLGWNDGYNDGDAYIDWGDKQYWDQNN